MSAEDTDKGIIAWMTHNRVTPNLLMLVLLVGGAFLAMQIKKEVFPDFTLDSVTVTVAYPGASPEEVEQGVILAIEENVRGLDGVKQVTATATEGSGSVTVEMASGADPEKLYQDVQQAVARITTFPKDTLQPQITLDSHRHDVLSIEVYGKVSEQSLRAAAERVRDGLLQSPDITQVDLSGARDMEIHVDVDQQTLRAHDLTLQQIADTISQSALDRAGGDIETRGGDILLRVKQRKDWARQFEKIPLLALDDGTVLRLGDVAHVSEGFADVHRSATFDGQPAIGVDVYRIGNQTPIQVAQATRHLLPKMRGELPPAVHLVVRHDASEIYQQRLHLLLSNGFMGLVVVLVLLSLFLEFKLAFWVTMGIPTSFLGAFLFLPGMGVSLNMVSMFAFIVALGIVVDDAIVAGENIYEYRQRGMGTLQAAILGARDVAGPVTFSILTNIVAFLPMATVPGTFGKIWAVIPAVVATVFTISWVEALLILPSHLGHTREGTETRFGTRLHAWQQDFSRKFSHFVEHRYGPFMHRAVHHRYLTLAAALGLLIIVLAIPVSGHMGFILMPKVESDRAQAQATLPVGSPTQRVDAVRDRMVAAARKVVADHGGDKLGEGVVATVDDNSIRVSIYLTQPDVRPISTAEVTRLWRQAVGQVPGVESMRFASDSGGPGGGASVSVELSHSNIAMLDKASADLAQRLSEISYTRDIDDGFSRGKSQLSFQLRPEARAEGLTASDVANQVRNAFYGAEALKQQRGRNEITVRVRLPKNERNSEADVENLLLHLPAGGYVPLYQVANVDRGHAFTDIHRRDGRRTVTVTADVEPIDATSQVLATLKQSILPQLVADYPGLSYSFQGRQASMRDAVNSFYNSVTIALLGIFVLLAIPFRSYVQPAIVMVAIPFGLVGAILGHLLMGYSLSLISVMGIIALSGVVVNDSLVMIDYANRRRREGHTAYEAITQAGIRRFRPIMLTTLTTFGGLAPMIFETSRQARFMIPMAISLGYGILFSTAIMLLLVPCLYMAMEDIRESVGQLGRKLKESLTRDA